MRNERRLTGWAFPILQIVFALLLFFLIIWSYLHFPRYGSAWLIVGLCCVLFAYLRLDRIREFAIWKLFKFKTTQPGEALSEGQKDKMQSQLKRSFEDEGRRQMVLAEHDLSILLANYSFFYGRQDAPSDVIRFSDAFSGRPLRYINHLSQELDRYLSKYSRYLRKPLHEAVKALKTYIDHVSRYHKKEEKLSQPVFSVQEYKKLVKDIAEAFRAENFQASL